MPTNTLRRSAWIIALVSLIWAIVLALNLVPLLRGGYGWRWPYAFPPEYPERFLVLALSIGLYLGGAWFLFRRRRALTIILWSIVGSIGLTLAVLYMSTSNLRSELFARTASSVTTGWHYAAADFDDNGGGKVVLSTWTDFMPEYRDISGHLMVSPPGIPTLYYVSNKALERTPALADLLGRSLRAGQCHNYRLMGYTNAELASAWLGILSPLWGSLTVLPLYWLGRRLYGEQAAWWAVLWWPLIPSFLMFTPTPSTVYPLLSLVNIALLAQGLRHNRPIWVVLSGVMMSLLSFMAFTFLPLIIFAGVLTLVTYFNRRTTDDLPWYWPFVTGAWYGVGLVSFWIAYYALYGLWIWDIFLTAMNVEHLTLDRPYLPWVFLHLNDFFTFTGWPLVLLGGVAAAQIVRKKKVLSRGQVLIASTILTVFVLDVSGMGRGESGRVWLFLAPFFLLMAASVLSDSCPSRFGWLITATQAIMVLALVTFVHVIDSGLSDPPDAPPLLDEFPQTPYIASGAVFGDVLHLTGFAGQIATLPDAESDLRPTLVLWLNWQSSGQIDRPYYLGFIPVTPDGQPTEAVLIQPFGQVYPTTCWLPGSGLLQDRIEIPLSISVADGDWWVSLSLVDGQTGEKLGVTMPDGSQSDQVGLGPFRQQSE